MHGATTERHCTGYRISCCEGFGHRPTNSFLSSTSVFVAASIYIVCTALHVSVCSALVFKTHSDGALFKRTGLSDFDDYGDDGAAFAKHWSAALYSREFFPETNNILHESQPPDGHFDDLERLEPVFPHFGKRREQIPTPNVLQKRWGLPADIINRQDKRSTNKFLVSEARSSRPLYGRQPFPFFGGFPPPPSPFVNIGGDNRFFSNDNGDNFFNTPRQFPITSPNSFVNADNNARPPFQPQFSDVADYDENTAAAANADHRAHPLSAVAVSIIKPANIPPPLQTAPQFSANTIRPSPPLPRPPIVFSTSSSHTEPTIGGAHSIEPLPFHPSTRPNDIDDLTRYFELPPSGNTQLPPANFNNRPPDFSANIQQNLPPPAPPKNFQPIRQHNNEYRPPPVRLVHVPLQPQPTAANNPGNDHVHPPPPPANSLGPPLPDGQGPFAPFNNNIRPFNPPTPSLFTIPLQQPLSAPSPLQQLFVDSHKIHPVNIVGFPPSRHTIDRLLDNSLPPVPPSYHANGHEEQELINVFNPVNPIASAPQHQQYHPPPPPRPFLGSVSNMQFQLQQPLPFTLSTTTSSRSTTTTTPVPVISKMKYSALNYMPPMLKNILPSDTAFSNNGKPGKPLGSAFTSVTRTSSTNTEFERASGGSQVDSKSQPAAVINNIPSQNDQQHNGNSPNVYVTNQILYGELPSLAALGFSRLQQQQSTSSLESTPQIFAVNYASTSSTTNSPTTIYSPVVITSQNTPPTTRPPPPAPTVLSDPNSSNEPNYYGAILPSAITALPPPLAPASNAVFFASKPQQQNTYNKETAINIEPYEPSLLTPIGPLLQHIPDPGQHVGAVVDSPLDQALPQPFDNYYPPPQQWTIKNIPSPAILSQQQPPPASLTLPLNTAHEQPSIIQHIPDESVAGAPRPLPPPPLNNQFFNNNALPADNNFTPFDQQQPFNENVPNPNFPPSQFNEGDGFFFDNNNNFVEHSAFPAPFLAKSASPPIKNMAGFGLSQEKLTNVYDTTNKIVSPSASHAKNQQNRFVDNGYGNTFTYDGQSLASNPYTSKYLQNFDDPPNTVRGSPQVLKSSFVASPALPFNMYDDDSQQKRSRYQPQQQILSVQQSSSNHRLDRKLNYGYASRGFPDDDQQPLENQPKTTISTYFSPRRGAAPTEPNQRVVFVDVNTNVVELSRDTACLNGEGVYPLPGTCMRYYYCAPRTMENPPCGYRVFELVCSAGMIYDIKEEGCVQDSNTRRLLCKFYASSSLRGRSAASAADTDSGRRV